MALQCCFCRVTGSLVNGYIKQICSCIKWTLRSAIKTRKLKPLCSNTTWWRPIWSLSESPRTVYCDIRLKGVCPLGKSSLCAINRRLGGPQSTFGRSRGKKTPLLCRDSNLSQLHFEIATNVCYKYWNSKLCDMRTRVQFCLQFIHFQFRLLSVLYRIKKKSGMCRDHVSPPGCAPKPLDRFP